MARLGKRVCKKEEEVDTEILNGQNRQLDGADKLTAAGWQDGLAAKGASCRA